MSTPRELAEKIVSCLNGNCDCKVHLDNTEQVEYLLTGALAEAKEEGAVNENERHGNVDYLKEIRAAAYEDAAKIVEADCDWNSGYSVKEAADRAAKIRLRAGEMNEKSPPVE